MHEAWKPIPAVSWGARALLRVERGAQPREREIMFLETTPSNPSEGAKRHPVPSRPNRRRCG